MSNPELDAALADHRVLTAEEAMHVAKSLLILEQHATGIRTTGNHPDREQAANVISNIIGPVGDLLEMMLNCGMIAPRGYRPAGK